MKTVIRYFGLRALCTIHSLYFHCYDFISLCISPSPYTFLSRSNFSFHLRIISFSLFPYYCCLSLSSPFLLEAILFKDSSLWVWECESFYHIFIKTTSNYLLILWYSYHSNIYLCFIWFYIEMKINFYLLLLHF
jgi:hypothetical protein